MIDSTTPAPDAGGPRVNGEVGSVSPVAYQVRTSALDQLCADLQRAVEQGRRLLEHPGVVRGQAQDAGDDDLRDAAVHLADRWTWGLQVLLDDATTLLQDVRSAAQLYDEVERTTVAVPPTLPGLTR